MGNRPSGHTPSSRSFFPSLSHFRILDTSVHIRLFLPRGWSALYSYLAIDRRGATGGVVTYVLPLN